MRVLESGIQPAFSGKCPVQVIQVSITGVGGRCLLHRPEGHRDGTRGGQARHDDHLFLDGGPVRVLGGTMLDGSGAETLRIHRLPIELHVELLKEKEVTDLEEDEEDKQWKKVRLVISP